MPPLTIFNNENTVNRSEFPLFPRPKRILSKLESLPEQYFNTAREAEYYTAIRIYFLVSMNVTRSRADIIDNL